MSYVGRAKQIGRGFVIAEAVTALSLPTIPITAHAKGQGVRATIGLGILGGAIAGATVASPPLGLRRFRCRQRKVAFSPSKIAASASEISLQSAS